MDDTRFIHKIRPYTLAGVERYSMFVTDKQTGCVVHKDVPATQVHQETKKALVAQLKARLAGQS